MPPEMTALPVVPELAPILVTVPDNAPPDTTTLSPPATLPTESVPYEPETAAVSEAVPPFSMTAMDEGAGTRRSQLSPIGPYAGLYIPMRGYEARTRCRQRQGHHHPHNKKNSHIGVGLSELPDSTDKRDSMNPAIYSMNPEKSPLSFQDGEARTSRARGIARSFTARSNTLPGRS